MNVGFEDISILKEMMEKYRTETLWIWKSRKPNADAIASSYRNFLEMSSKTADDKFHRKKIEKVFFRHPDKWIPLYSRVTFSDRPYSEALALVIFKTKTRM
jgi:kynurenine 3-monooxygenase